MGLFTKKKEEKSISSQASAFDTADLPEFPTLPDLDEGLELPSYEPTVSDIKKEVERESDEVEIPVREKNAGAKVMINTTTKIGSDMSARTLPDGDKPLFVKIEKYKEIMHMIDAINSKLSDAENLLHDLEKVRNDEQEKLEAWKKDLENVKEKLLSVDKDLFEV